MVDPINHCNVLCYTRCIIGLSVLYAKKKLEKLAIIAVKISLYISTKLLGLFSAVSFVTESANISNGENILMVIFMMIVGMIL